VTTTAIRRGPDPVARRPSGHHRAPLVEVLERYQRAGTVPFSCPGHKLGGGADTTLVALLGPRLFAADVWLDTATHDRTLRAAEALTAAAWGADRCLFLGNGSSSGNHAFLLAATVLGMLAHAGTRLAAWLLPARTPAPATDQLDLDPIFDWRDARMDQQAPPPPEPPPDWARVLRRSRYRRRRPVAQWALGALLLVAVGGAMFQAGQAVAPTRPAAATPVLTTHDAGRHAAAPKATRAPAPRSTAAPPRPRVLTLITRNIRSEADPNRVYLSPGKVTAGEASRGKRPEFAVRPGEVLRVRVHNQDRYIHSFTFAKARVNLDAWEGTVSAATFRAPRKPGVYEFYCRYRKVGMSGTLVVRG
jgi:plastocyanin